jgi:hypothetical protein
LDRSASSQPGQNGQRIEVGDLGTSLILPSGWRGQLGTGSDGQPVYEMLPAGVSPDQAGVKVATGKLAAEELAMTLRDLVARAGNELLETLSQASMQNGASLQWDQRRDIQTLTIDGRPAARMLVRGTLHNTMTGKRIPVECYFATIKGQAGVAVVIGTWEQALSARVRPGTDAVLHSLRPAPLKVTSAAQSRYAGCWNTFSGETSYGGGSFSQRVLRLGRNGTYRRESHMQVNASVGGAGSSSSEEGTWRQVGSAIAFNPRNGAPYTVSARLNGGALMLNNTRLIPCD